MMGSSGDFGATVPDEEGMKYYTCELECGFTLGGEGAFEKVALHEKTCKGRPEARAEQEFADAVVSRVLEQRAAPAPAPAPEHESGWSATIAERMKAMDEAKNQRNPQYYVCEKGCGFSGSFAVVEKHEQTCFVRPYTLENVVCDVCNMYAGTESEVRAHRVLCEINPANAFQCEKGCGKIGTWKIIADHETRCNGIPSGQRGAEDTRARSVEEMKKRGDFFICERRCGFTDIFEVVQEHEKTCRFVPDAVNDIFKPSI